MKQRIYLLAALLALTLAALASAGEPIPLLYVTDLYQPHSDPDDHYDLMCLYAFDEFDLQGIIIDRGPKGNHRAGRCAIAQMEALTGKKVACALGLEQNLATQEDPARNDPAQAGVTMILDTLEKAPSPLTIFSTGSARDLAAAFNRDPELFRKKLGALYLNAGAVGEKLEWNVELDVHAYVRLLQSGLPIYWAPCFGEAGWQTYWTFDQGAYLDGCCDQLTQFFLYMLTKQDPQQVDPRAWLKAPPDKAGAASVYKQRRNMWCTGPFLHAAERPLPGAAFQPLTVYLTPDGRSRREGEGRPLELKTFRILDQTAYEAGMLAALETAGAQLCAREEP